MNIGGGALITTRTRNGIRSLMPVYEDNYRLMLRWMPSLPAIRRPVSLLLDGTPGIRLCIHECGPYTSSGHVSQPFSLHGPRYLRDLVIGFRVYHDAQLIEVLAYQGRSRFAPHYPYPNRDLRSPFEKRQVNLFLGEWLRARLRLGQRFDGVRDCAHVTDLKVEN